MNQWADAIKIEHQVSKIITQQEMNGWEFNLQQAQEKVEWLTHEQDKLYKIIRPLLTKEVINVNGAVVHNPFNSNGSISKRATKYLGDMDQYLSGPFSPISIVEPDIGSRYKLIKQLERHGWKPIELTEKGNPRLTEESLEFLEGDVGKAIARWYILGHRRAQISGWTYKIRPDGRIQANANPLGTPTGRMRHSVVVNVPKANSDKEGNLLYFPHGNVIYGTEMRELFTVPDGYVLIGHDASGLEARMLAHWMDDEGLTNEILHGDFHTTIWKPIDKWVFSRGGTKNIEYALLYGAQDYKLGTMTDVYSSRWSEKKTQRMGAQVRKAIMTALPALDDLTQRVQKASDRGWLRGLDGRRVPVRSKHAALNTLNQSAAAQVMKKSMCYIDDWLRNEGATLNEVKKVGDFHDEGQAEVIDDKKIIELYSDFAVQSIRKAGEYFKLRCPLDAEAKVGMNWAETH